MKQQLFWAIIVFVCSTLIRVFYAVHSPLYITTGDSVSYALTAKQIIETKQLVDPFRTPGYPLLLAAPYVLTNTEFPQEISGVYTSGLYAIRIIQSIFMIASAVAFYLLVLRVGISAPIAALFTIVGTSDYVILLLEHSILTESLSLCLLVLISYCTYCLIRKFSISAIGVLVMLWIGGVFLRPSFIGVPLLSVSIIWMRYRTMNIALLCALALVVYGGSVSMYSSVNANQNGVKGISRIGDINIWGKLLKMNVSDTALGNSQIADMARNARRVNATHPFEIFRQYPQLYQKKYAGEFHGFVTQVLRASYGAFIWDSFLSIPSVISSPTDLQDVTATTGKFDAFFKALKSFYGLLVYVAYIPLCAAPFALFVSWKKQEVALYGQVFLLLVGVYHIAVMALLSYNDFGRLMSTARPFLLVASYCVIIFTKRILYGKKTS